MRVSSLCERRVVSGAARRYTGEQRTMTNDLTLWRDAVEGIGRQPQPHTRIIYAVTVLLALWRFLRTDA